MQSKIVLGVLAVEATSGTNLEGILLSAGVAGVVVILFATGRIYSKSTVDYLKEEIVKLHGIISVKDQQLAELHGSTNREVFPAIRESTNAIQAMEADIEQLTRRIGGERSDRDVRPSQAPTATRRPRGG